MSRKLDLQIKAIRKKYGNRVAREFTAAVADITNNITQAKERQLIRLIKSGDINGALRLLDIDAAAFSRVSRAITAAYEQTGVAVTAGTVWRGIEGQRMVVRWDMSNPRAERWVREIGTRSTNTMVANIASSVRQVISEGYSTGQGPSQIALDIVGRVGATGRRSGGIIGLSGPQTNHVQSMRNRLREGDMRAVLRMTKRDHRFDASIRKHIANGTRPSNAEITKWTGRYSDRLLKLRGDTIARTETGAAVESAKLEGFKQWQDKSGVPDEFITRSWLHAGGGKQNRDWHKNMRVNTVQGLTTPFITSHGASMLHPLDSSLGAGAEEIANCRCTGTIKVDHAGLLRSRGG